MTVLATYNPSLSAQLCKVTSIDLPSTEGFYCISCLSEIRFIYIYVSYVTAGAKEH